MENTPDNRKKLAEEVTSFWNDEELLAYAIQQLTKGYKEDSSMFHRDWNTVFEDK